MCICFALNISLEKFLKNDSDTYITKHRIKYLAVKLNATLPVQSITFRGTTNGAMNNNVCFIHSSMGLQFNSFPAASCLLWNALFIGRFTLKCFPWNFEWFSKNQCVFWFLWFFSVPLIISATCHDCWSPVVLVQ